MTSYRDKYDRFHNKPVTAKDEYPCNNAWIYTSYVLKTGIYLYKPQHKECYEACSIKMQTRTELLRNPGKSLPPVSRDEILGMSYLKVLRPEHLQGWNFSPYPMPKFNLFKLISQLVEARGKHRNHFWQNNLDQIYRFAFSVPFSDRHFLLKNWGKFQSFNPVHLFYAAFGKISSKFKPNGLDWLKYDEEKGKELAMKEFPEDHPIKLFGK